MQETFTEQGETHHRHRRAAVLRPLRRSPTLPPIPDSELAQETRARKEARRGREREAQTPKYKREKKNGIRLLRCGCQVTGGVWNSTSQVNRGKRWRREGGGDTGGPVGRWGWSADAIGTGCRGAGSVARSSCSCPSPSVPLPDGVKDDRLRHSVPTGNATVPRKRRASERAFALGFVCFGFSSFCTRAVVLYRLSNNQFFLVCFYENHFR